MGKIIFTEDEKKEFDIFSAGFKQDMCSYDLQEMFDEIAENREDYPNLGEKLFNNGSVKKDIEQQINFAKALENPDNIVIQQEDKYLIKAIDSEDGYLNYDFSAHSLIVTTKEQVHDMVTHFTENQIQELAEEYNRPGFEIDKMERILVVGDDVDE